ncbi:MAG: RNA polymerase sigma factor [Planctomycetota bacterium]
MAPAEGRAESWRAREARPTARAASPVEGALTTRVTMAAEQNTSPSDAELVRAALAGEEAAFRTLVERYQRRAFWIARGMLQNDEDALDVAQEAFLRVHRSLDRFDLQLKFSTWLHQIVVNLSIDHMRRQRRRKGVELEAVGEVADQRETHDPVEGEELQRRVARVLEELPPKYKAVMVLSDLQGMGAKQIAEITDTTHATVRWRHHRARKLFREAWERIYGKGSHVC